METATNGTKSLFNISGEALKESGQIWTTGCQEISKKMTIAAKSHLTESMSNWNAICNVKSFDEAKNLQIELTRKYFDTMIAETTEMTDAFSHLAKKAIAPLKAQISHAVEANSSPAG